MPAVFGAAALTMGSDEGKTVFIAVSDGSKTQFLLPDDTSDYMKEDILRAMGSRLGALETSDPEEIVDSLSYNFPVEIEMSDLFDTYEEAVSAAQDSMSLVNDLDEEESPLLDAIMVTEDGETE